MARHRMYGIAAVAAALLLAGSVAEGGLIQTTPGDVAVLAGGYLSTDRGVSVHGSIGAVGGAWFDRDFCTTGSVYTGTSMGVDRDAVIGGRLVSGGGVWMDRASSVAGIDAARDVGLGRDVTVAGSVTAGRGVGIDRGSLVQGDVSYGSGYWISGSATVEGDVGRDLRQPDTWTTTLRDEPTWGGLGGSTYYGRGENVTLAPGAHKGLNVDRDATITLTAGTYDLGSVWLGRDVTLVADTSAGDVVLNVDGSLSTDSGVTFTDTGAGAFLVQADRAIYLGQSTQAEASFRSYASLGIDADSEILGRLYAAGDVWLGRNTSVDGGIGGPVPEPATLALLGTGFAAIMLRRRARRR